MRCYNNCLMRQKPSAPELREVSLTLVQEPSYCFSGSRAAVVWATSSLVVAHRHELDIYYVTSLSFFLNKLCLFLIGQFVVLPKI